jgi:hypothetical protein
MTLTIPNLEHAQHLDLSLDEATITGPPSADARKEHAKHMADALRVVSGAQAAEILMRADVQQAFEDSRAAIDAWKKTL